MKLSNVRSIVASLLIGAMIFVVLTIVPSGPASELVPESLMVVSWSWPAGKLLFSLLIAVFAYDRLSGGLALD